MVELPLAGRDEAGIIAEQQSRISELVSDVADLKREIINTESESFREGFAIGGKMGFVAGLVAGVIVLSLLKFLSEHMSWQ